ncbi:MAG: aminomethyl transferase family protein [Desulfosarcinaceae bacterium]
MNGAIQKTPLYDWHVSHQAKMENFGGFLMPMWYASAKSEHLAVLTHAGLFDTSHMDTLTVRGRQAHDLLQHCFTKDLDRCQGPKQSPLSTGRCVYGAFLDEQGHAVDDAIVYKMAEAEYMVVVNAGMGSVICGHLEAHRGAMAAEVTNLSGRLGKIDLQGPMAVRILQQALAEPDQGEGTAALLSRTGYTGEIGFEFFCPTDRTASLWQALLEAGQSLGVVPCGLAARDSLRAGAVLPLSHQDIGHWPFINHPWPFALPYTPDGAGFTKDFIGARALLEAKDAMYTCAFAGFDPRKIPPGETSVLDDRGQEIGTILTCATDMGIGRHEDVIYSIASPDRPAGFKPAGLSCGFVKVSCRLSPGERIKIKDKRRAIEVEAVTDIRPARTARQPLKNFLG